PPAASIIAHATPPRQAKATTDHRQKPRRCVTAAGAGPHCRFRQWSLVVRRWSSKNWRECVGIEPTEDRVNCLPQGLKPRGPTRTQPPPRVQVFRCSGVQERNDRSPPEHLNT